MAQKVRRERILALLAEQGFATAKELERVLGISAATVHRDLAAMEALHLVKRCWGGVECAEGARIPPLPLRYDFRKREKKHTDSYMCQNRHAPKTEHKNDNMHTRVKYMLSYLAYKRDRRVLPKAFYLFLG